jgi:penicillin-binding protein 1A
MAQGPPNRKLPTRKLPTLGRLRWLRLALLGGLGVLVLGIAAGAATFLLYASDPELPRIGSVADYRPKVVTKVFARGGELIGEIYEERRTLVSRADIPDVMIHALVDAEDAEFYQHHGLSYWGMLRAIVNDLKPGAHLQGASTLTQQLVRNLLLKTNARTAKRKIQELILSRRIETALTKDEILALYLNQIELPYSRFGIEEAARFYFGKGIREVDAGEAALLASLFKGGNIDPLKHAERAKERQRYVLSQMVRYGHLSAAEADKFAKAPIKLVKSAAPYLGSAPEYVDEVKKTLVERYGQKKLPYLGLSVYTRCDAKIQKLARESVEKGLVELDARQGNRKPLHRLSKPAEQKKWHDRLEKEFPSEPGLGKVVEGLITQLSDADPASAIVDLGGTSGTLPLPASVDRYNPKAQKPSERFAAGDVVRVRVLEPGKGHADGKPVLGLELGPQAAMVVIEPTSRDVLALVGGYGFRAGAFDRAVDAKRQPGSAFKPILYAAALDTGRFTAASVLVDGPQVYTSPGMAPWKPKNSEKEEFLGPVRLRVALAKSLNTVASQLMDVEREGVDPNVVVTLAKSLGIESPLAPNPSLALGTSEVRPLELTNAYASIAAGGRHRAPRFIERVVTPKGGIVSDEGVPLPDVPEPDQAETQALRPEVAFVVTSMMSSVIESGTAASAKGKLGRPAAGKTGTTNSHKDAWFVGFTADLATGVWVGYDDMRELGHGEQGARAALPIWVSLMTLAHNGLPPRPFGQPPGLVSAKIDPASGLLAAPGAGNALDEWFIEGTAPTAQAPSSGEANPDTYLLEQN